MKFNALSIATLFAVNSTFAIDLPFTETFEGSLKSTIENYPANPATYSIKSCPTGRTGQCLFLDNLVSKSADYLPSLIIKDLTMQNGETYTVSLFSKSSQSNIFKAYVKVQYEAWVPISDEVNCFTSTEWQQCTFSFKANIPSTVTNPSSFALYLQLATVSGSLWLDDISITKGSQTTTSSCQPVTVSSNLSIHIPNAIYQPIFSNSQNLWVDLVPISTNDGKLGWGLKNYGLNQ
jgi:hypothetical protein